MGLVLSTTLLLTCTPISKRSAQATLARVNKIGAERVYKELWRDGVAWETVLNQIETGDLGWLEVAETLKQVTDAGASESMNIAVARALPKSPKAVLNMVGDRFSIECLCTVPFIEATREVEDTYLRSAEAALNNLTAPKMEKERLACLKRIKTLLEQENIPGSGTQTF